MIETLAPSRGSSPRVRGKLDDPPRQDQGARLIPACAGKTNPAKVSDLSCSAHPRVCGENFSLFRRNSRPRGSSPRVRGKPASAAHSFTNSGLIPACAGKTFRYPIRSRARPAHPRVCGENVWTTDQGRRGVGSSPRVRGKLGVGVVAGLLRRLIPACAGKTPRPRHSKIRLWAHPRVCGENILKGL